MLLLLMLFFYAAQADALTSWTKHKINIVFYTLTIYISNFLFILLFYCGSDGEKPHEVYSF